MENVLHETLVSESADERAVGKCGIGSSDIWLGASYKTLDESDHFMEKVMSCLEIVGGHFNNCSSHGANSAGMWNDAWFEK